MNSPVALREIRPDDEPFLFEVYASTREEELAQVPWTDAQKQAFLEMQFQAQHRFYQEMFSAAAFDLVVQDGAPIGRLYVDRRCDEIRVIDIAILPAHRNAGIGSALLRNLLDEAFEAGLPVRIHVERYNRALRLYERLGFEPVEEQGVHYLMEWLPAERGE